MITDQDQDDLDTWADDVANVTGQHHRLEDQPAAWLRDFAEVLHEGNELLERLRAKLMPNLTEQQP